jgi:hypothetical protein
MVRHDLIKIINTKGAVAISPFFHMKRYDKQTGKILIEDPHMWAQMQLDLREHRAYISSVNRHLPAGVKAELNNNYERFKSLWQLMIPMQEIKRFTPYGGAGYNSRDWDHQYSRLLQQYIQSDFKALDHY